jgi:methylthioribose-1-phosphate isomerase
VRGAPAIGVAAAFGVALAARQARPATGTASSPTSSEAIAGLGATRPTAVNLFWALDRMRRAAVRIAISPRPREGALARGGRG